MIFLPPTLMNWVIMNKLFICNFRANSKRCNNNFIWSYQNHNIFDNTFFRFLLIYLPCCLTCDWNVHFSCDECRKCYHFTCLEPPLKKSPKKRGYSWHCADCDPTVSNTGRYSGSNSNKLHNNCFVFFRVPNRLQCL